MQQITIPPQKAIAFVDYENYPQFAQGRDLNIYQKIYLLIGCQQKQVPVSLLQQLLPIGRNVEIICIAEQAKNNLDFRLVLYLGKCDAELPKEIDFVIFSNDTGFDPTIKYLKNELKRNVKRIMNVVESKKAA